MVRDLHKAGLIPAEVAQTACTCARLRRITRKLTQRYDEFLAPSGLRITQFSLLAMLQDGEPPSVSTLADKMGTERTTLTRNVRHLIDEGLVSMEDGRNARTRALFITEKGRRAFQRALPLWWAAQSDTRSRMSEAGLNELHDTLSSSMKRLFGS